MSLPTEMKAVVIHEHGDPSVIQYETINVPTISNSQVLVEVHHAGINYIDTYHRTGLYPNPLPLTLGREGAGKVVAVGSDVTDLKVGDMVTFFAQGAYAQYTAVEAHSAIVLPSGVTTTMAAAALLQGLTAHYLITSAYVVKPGDAVLIHAAAGGTGALVAQIARHKGASIIIGTVGSNAKIEIAKAAGCTHVINYSETDFLPEVKKITNNLGVHAAYDGVGKDTYDRSMKSLRKLGTLVLFGNASGPVPPINPLELTKNGSIYITRPTLADYIYTRQLLVSRTNDVLEWLRDGIIKLSIAKTLPLESAAEGHKLLEGRGQAGKILLEIVKAE